MICAMLTVIPLMILWHCYKIWRSAMCVWLLLQSISENFYRKTGYVPNPKFLSFLYHMVVKRSAQSRSEIIFPQNDKCLEFWLSENIIFLQKWVKSHFLFWQNRINQMLEADVINAQYVSNGYAQQCVQCRIGAMASLLWIHLL